MNEYLRNHVTLDAWVWFFAFARIELILGFMVSTLPIIFFMEESAPRTDGDGE